MALPRLHLRCSCPPPPRLVKVCVWKLGAPTAAMFFGLRLVFSVVLSTPILGTTVIQTGVQVRGLGGSGAEAGVGCPSRKRGVKRPSVHLHSLLLPTAHCFYCCR